MSDVIKSDPSSINDPGDSYVNTVDADPAETQEWLESLQYVLSSKGKNASKVFAVGFRSQSVGGWRRHACQIKHGLHQHDLKRRHTAVSGQR